MMKLYSYYHSSAAYRVRIALGLKGQSWDDVAVDLVENEQRGDAFLRANPQGLVPALVLEDGTVIGQSTAMLEWLEEAYPTPALYPAESVDRARIRALCQHIACDIHPLNNLRVLRYLKQDLQLSQDRVDAWYAHWIHRGFSAVEQAIADFGAAFSLGSEPGMFEAFLVPQVYNARRFAVELHNFPAILELDARCQELPAFHAAHPLRQPDTPEDLRRT